MQNFQFFDAEFCELTG